jgi:serine/threonine protein kinase
MIETGKTLQQRYKIDKQIGQGGMGAVYVATDERFGSTVAIKETLCMDDNFRKAIEREARLLNSLKHGALPRVSDHFEEDNGLFLVMEYIAGDDVGSILERAEKPFAVDQVMKWADQLLDALDYLHNQVNPVVHRDIKPQNLKITPRGEIILLDFGLAKGNPTDAGHQTAAKSIFGYSRNYASLEQIQGTGTDPRSDLYSLAATLYHLLTNTPPEDALTRAMAVLSQRPDPLVPANAINSEVPRGIAGVLHRAMALNAEERPASALQMRQMLRQSDEFGYLADPSTIATSAVRTSAFGSATSAGADGTFADPSRHTEAKTEVLPAYASQLTSVRSDTGEHKTQVALNSTTAAPKKRRTGLVAAAAAAVLVGFGGVVGSVYVLNPSLFGSSGNQSGTVAPAPAEPGLPPATSGQDQTTSSSTADAQANAAPAAPSLSADPVRPQSQPERSADSAKGDKQASNSKTIVSGSDEDGDFSIDMSGTDKMTLTKRDKTGKVTTMQVPVPRPPYPGAPPPGAGFNPFPKGFDMNVLKPEQQQKLQEMLRRQEQIRQDRLRRNIYVKPANKPDQPER